MIGLKRLPLVLAAALVVVQPALACCCLEDLAAQALEPVAEIPSCHEAPESGSSDTHGNSPHGCSDCADYETVLGNGGVKAFGPKDQPGFKLPPVDTNAPAISTRPQIVRIIGPPPSVARPAQTLVVLKQLLLI